MTTPLSMKRYAISEKAMKGDESITLRIVPYGKEEKEVKSMSNINETTKSVSKVEYPVVEKMPTGETKIHLNTNVYVEIYEGTATIRLIEHSDPKSHKEQTIEFVWEYIRNHDKSVVRNVFAQLKLYASGSFTANMAHGCTMISDKYGCVELGSLYKAYEGLKAFKELLGLGN